MVAYAIGKIQDIECSTKETTMEEVMIDIVDRYFRVNGVMGPAKCEPTSGKQSDGKDGKKKGDQSARANPAVKDGLKPVCQICGMEPEALQT
jgi:hypothetical protein